MGCFFFSLKPMLTRTNNPMSLGLSEGTSNHLMSSSRVTCTLLRSARVIGASCCIATHTIPCNSHQYAQCFSMSRDTRAGRHNTLPRARARLLGAWKKRHGGRCGGRRRQHQGSRRRRSRRRRCNTDRHWHSCACCRVHSRHRSRRPSACVSVFASCRPAPWSMPTRSVATRRRTKTWWRAALCEE